MEPRSDMGRSSFLLLPHLAGFVYSLFRTETANCGSVYLQ